MDWINELEPYQLIVGFTLLIGLAMAFNAALAEWAKKRWER